MIRKTLSACGRRRPSLLAAVWLALMPAGLAAAPISTVSLPTDRQIAPDGPASGIVFLLSDSGGWTAVEQSAAAQLAADGALVVGIDLPSYYAALRRETRRCLYLVADIERASKALHRQAGLTSYRPPVLAGLGEGATLALAMTAQSPQATIGATVAVDPSAVVPLQTPLCTPAAKTPAPGGMTYGLAPGPLPQPVSIAFSRKAAGEGRAHAAGLKADHPAILLSDSGGDDGAVLLQGIRAARAPVAAAAASLDLPIVALDAVPRFDTMAVIYSGDGGWRDIDQKIGAYLQEAGVPVVGVDALRYFWSEKSPQQTAADLSRIIVAYRARWQVGKVVLVGYSFGANILPATYLQLPAADRQSVTLLSVLALSHAADFEIALRGWLGAAGAASHGDPAQHLSGVEPGKIQCIEGRADRDSACPALRPLLARGAQIVTREGGHHFDGDYRALSAIILDRLAAPRPASDPPATLSGRSSPSAD